MLVRVEQWFSYKKYTVYVFVCVTHKLVNQFFERERNRIFLSALFKNKTCPHLSYNCLLMFISPSCLFSLSSSSHFFLVIPFLLNIMEFLLRVLSKKLNHIVQYKCAFTFTLQSSSRSVL
jgi:hypothetical protein